MEVTVQIPFVGTSAVQTVFGLGGRRARRGRPARPTHRLASTCGVTSPRRERAESSVLAKGVEMSKIWSWITSWSGPREKQCPECHSAVSKAEAFCDVCGYDIVRHAKAGGGQRPTP
jgi:hypothetical protein